MGKFGAQVRGQSWGTESGMDEISGTRGKGDNPSLVDFSQAPRELVKRQQGRETVNQGPARVRGMKGKGLQNEGIG